MPWHWPGICKLCYTWSPRPKSHSAVNYITFADCCRGVLLVLQIYYVSHRINIKTSTMADTSYGTNNDLDNHSYYLYYIPVILLLKTLNPCSIKSINDDTLLTMFNLTLAYTANPVQPKNVQSWDLCDGSWKLASKDSTHTISWAWAWGTGFLLGVLAWFLHPREYLLSNGLVWSKSGRLCWRLDRTPSATYTTAATARLLSCTRTSGVHSNFRRRNLRWWVVFRW